MSQNTKTFVDGTGAQLITYLNNIVDSIISKFSGAGAPSETQAFKDWMDTANSLWKIRDSTNASWKIVGKMDTDYLGCAALSVKNVFTASQIPSRTAPAATSGTINWDMALYQTYEVSLNGAGTMAAPTNITTGGYYGLRVVQDATGGRILAFNSVFKGMASYTQNTSANNVDFLIFYSPDGTNLNLVGVNNAVAT